MKKIKPLVIDKETMWQTKKPRYNAYMIGHGAHKNKKAYSRKSKYPVRYE